MSSTDGLTLNIQKLLFQKLNGMDQAIMDRIEGKTCLEFKKAKHLFLALRCMRKILSLLNFYES